ELAQGEAQAEGVECDALDRGGTVEKGGEAGLDLPADDGRDSDPHHQDERGEGADSVTYPSQPEAAPRTSLVPPGGGCHRQHRYVALRLRGARTLQDSTLDASDPRSEE